MPLTGRALDRWGICQMLDEWMAINSATQTAADAPHMLFNPVPLTTDIKIIANSGMKARQFINLDLCWSIL